MKYALLGSKRRTLLGSLTTPLACMMLSAVVHAELPSEFEPVAVHPKYVGEGTYEIDLTEASAAARAKGRLMYVYLGANNCAPCTEYSSFLKENAQSLQAAFRSFVVVEVKGDLRHRRYRLKAGEAFVPADDVAGGPGAGRSVLSFPYFWMLTPELATAKRMPRGSRNYMSVPKQLDALKVD